MRHLDHAGSALGYCIVHNDRTKQADGNDKTFFHVSEALLDDSFKTDNQVIPCKTTIATSLTSSSKEANFTGHYFTQQNQHTSVCGHAAIKMALQHLDYDVHTEYINNLRRTDQCPPPDHKEVTGMQPALKLKEIRKILEQLVSPKFSITSMSLESDGVSALISTIYTAIESRFPVILAFYAPREKQEDATGHVVALIGHTFSADCWESYAGKYFSLTKNNYIPSHAFVDDFVIQDDNMGPLYNISFQTFYALADYNHQVASYKERSHGSLLENPSAGSMTALIVHPESTHLWQTGTILKTAKNILNDAFSGYNKDDPCIDELCRTYFFDFFDHAPDKRKCAENLILRTLIISKEDYLNAESSMCYKKITSPGAGNTATVYDYLKENLPKYFWLVEISIPELYWVNRQKVGEMIFHLTEPKPIISDPLDPEALLSVRLQRAKDSIITLRVPNMLKITRQNSHATKWHSISTSALGHKHDLATKVKGVIHE